MSFLRPNRYPGKLIAIEGIGGSGKSLQARLLRQWLGERGSVSVAGHPERQFKTGTSISLAQAAELCERTRTAIVPALKAGSTVCADGYAYSACARSLVRGLNRKWVQNLYSFAINAHLVVYLRIAPELALRRIRNFQRSPELYEAGMDLGLSRSVEESFRLFQGRVGMELDKMAREFGFCVVDATLSIEAQQAEVRRYAASRR